MSENGMSQNGKWTPDRIRALRKERGQTQTEFGLDLYACGESDAQVRVSRLENGHWEPTQAVIRTLERMEAEKV